MKAGCFEEDCLRRLPVGLPLSATRAGRIWRGHSKQIPGCLVHHTSYWKGVEKACLVCVLDSFQGLNRRWLALSCVLYMYLHLRIYRVPNNCVLWCSYLISACKVRKLAADFCTACLE